MADSQLLVIVAVAMVAGVILFRLYAVLGRRTGNEREDRLRTLGGAVKKPADGLVALPDHAHNDAPALKPPDETARAMMDIKLADRNFETEHFVNGAKKAHELIVTAFARGDRNALRPLLSDEIYTAFDRALKDREGRKESVKFTLVGYKDVKISHASLKGRTAEITLNFVVQIISSTTNEAGSVIEGDPANVRDVTDVWTFARDLRGGDPNWTLVATSGGEI